MSTQKREPLEDKTASTSTIPSWLEIPLIILITVITVLLMTHYIGRIYYIPSGSMEGTLQAGDRVVAEKVTYYTKEPQAGDIIIFETPHEWENAPTDTTIINKLMGNDKNYMIKRIVATEGQTIRCIEGDPSVMVDGKPTNTDYIKNPPDNPMSTPEGNLECGGKYFDEITVPEDSYFVMGDNRTNSLDSRYHLEYHNGTIHKDAIVGKAQSVIFPINRLHMLKDEKIIE